MHKELTNEIGFTIKYESTHGECVHTPPVLRVNKVPSVNILEELSVQLLFYTQSRDVLIHGCNSQSFASNVSLCGSVMFNPSHLFNLHSLGPPLAQSFKCFCCSNDPFSQKGSLKFHLNPCDRRAGAEVLE